MRNPIQWIIVLLGGFCFIVNAYHAWDYLPVDNEVSGWTRDTTEKYKIWNDDKHPDDSLYDFIDGGANVYLDKGFKEGTILSYVKGDVEIGVTIYDQTLPDSAKVLYHELSQECVEDIASLGDSACLEIAIFSSCLKVIYKNFYIYINFPNDSLSLGVNFAGTIIRKIDNPNQIKHVSHFTVNTDMSIQTVIVPGVDMVKILYIGKDQRIFSLRIFDISGQLIEEQRTFINKSTIWDISDITTGFYFIELRSEKNMYYTRIMVMK